MATPVPQKDDVERWTVEQVAAWLQQVELADCCDTFLRRGIDGHRFLQLSQDDLFQWGRDVSIRNRLQILKLVSQIKNLQQHPCTTRQSIEISHDLGSQPVTTFNGKAVDSAVKDFSYGEEETEEYVGQEMQPVQEETVQGEGCIGDMYLQLLPASSTANYSSMLDRRFPNVPQPPSKVPLPSNNFSNIHHQKGVPWSLHPSSKKILTDRHNIESESQNNGMSYDLRIRQRIRQRAPAPLPEQSASSQNKASPTPPVPLRFQGQSPNMATCSSLPRTSTGQNNILRGPGSRSLETHNDDTLDDYKDSSFDEEETEEHSGQKMQPVKENAQGEECTDDLYLVPIRASPTTSHTGILNRELPTHLQQLSRLPSPSNNSSIIHQHGGVPWNQHPVKKEGFSFGSDTQNNGKSQTPAIPVRTPAPAPDTLTASCKLSPLHFQALAPSVAIHSSLQGASISHGVAENGSSGAKGGSSLHRHQFPSSTLPRWQTGNGSSQAHLPTHSMEKNDHEYEIVDIPQGSYGGTETPGPNMSDQQSPIRPPIPPPRNQNQDSDDKDLSRPVLHAHGRRPAAPLPPLARNQSEGYNTSQARPPAPDLPIRTNRSRQPKAPPSFSGNSSHSSHKIFPQESHAPQELAPMPTEGSLPAVSLGNGECIELTPLYRMIMDKPYFQFVSRSKAKELVLQGGEGTFLIRPSTRTDKPLTLTVKHDDRSYNINIRQRPDSLFALGNEKAPERTFSSIDEIVFTHYKEPITLENGECALLKYSPSKPSKSVYIKHVAPGP